MIVPANRRRMIEKAITSDADVLILDMEDAVVYSDDAKAEARRTVVEARKELDFKDKEVVIRANPVGSRWFDDDLKATIEARPHAMLTAKTLGVDDLRALDHRLMELGAPSDLRFWLGIETPSAMLHCEEIALASSRVEVLQFGLGDYTVGMQGQFTEDLDHLIFPLSKVLATARSLGLAASAATVVFSDLKRSDLVRNMALFLRKLGYEGATIVHPDHAPVVNEVFSPTTDEIKLALRQEEALKGADGEAALVLDGQLIEAVTIKIGQRTLAIARKLNQVSDTGAESR
jgi:citrate lyase beta subunit